MHGDHSVDLPSYTEACTPTHGHRGHCDTQGPGPTHEHNRPHHHPSTDAWIQALSYPAPVQTQPPTRLTTSTRASHPAPVPPPVQVPRPTTLWGEWKTLCKEDKPLWTVLLRLITIYNILSSTFLLVALHHYHGIFDIPQHPTHGDDRTLHVVIACIQVFLTLLSGMAGPSERFLLWLGPVYLLLSPVGPPLCFVAGMAVPENDWHWSAFALWILSIPGLLGSAVVTLMLVVGMVCLSAGLCYFQEI